MKYSSNAIVRFIRGEGDHWQQGCTFRDKSSESFTASFRPLSRTFGIPIKLSRTPGSLRTPPDDFGARGREVLWEPGYVLEEIDASGVEDVI